MNHQFTVNFPLMYHQLTVNYPIDHPFTDHWWPMNQTLMNHGCIALLLNKPMASKWRTNAELMTGSWLIHDQLTNSEWLTSLTKWFVILEDPFRLVDEPGYFENHQIMNIHIIYSCRCSPGSYWSLGSSIIIQNVNCKYVYVCVYLFIYLLTYLRIYIYIPSSKDIQ